MDLKTFNDAYAINDLSVDMDYSGVVDTNDLAVFAGEFGRIDCQ